jgi:hypothetical protein
MEVDGKRVLTLVVSWMKEDTSGVSTDCGSDYMLLIDAANFVVEAGCTDLARMKEQLQWLEWRIRRSKQVMERNVELVKGENMSNIMCVSKSFMFHEAPLIMYKLADLKRVLLTVKHHLIQARRAFPTSAAAPKNRKQYKEMIDSLKDAMRAEKMTYEMHEKLWDRMKWRSLWGIYTSGWQSNTILHSCAA